MSCAPRLPGLVELSFNDRHPCLIFPNQLGVMLCVANGRLFDIKQVEADQQKLEAADPQEDA